MKSNNPTYIPNELASAAVGGYVTSAEQIKDYNLGLDQEVINNIVLGDSINPSFTASPTPVFVNAESNISLNASIRIEADIVIKKGSEVLKNGRGTTLSHTDSLTPTSAGNTTYTAEFTIGGLLKTVNKNIVAVYPIYYGGGEDYTNARNQASVRTSPAGTYNISLSTSTYIWFVVPSTMSITRAIFGNLTFPLENATNVTINGVPYKVYRSSTPQAVGTYSIQIS